MAATGAHNYNVLQNNGSVAHQVVPHVHFHIIPKPDADQGLGVGWPSKPLEGTFLSTRETNMHTPFVWTTPQ
jgi:diadenosine tetraphosphate (Ap4A) HIT family hydrolase